MAYFLQSHQTHENAPRIDFNLGAVSLKGVSSKCALEARNGLCVKMAVLCKGDNVKGGIFWSASLRYATRRNSNIKSWIATLRFAVRASPSF